MPTTLPGLNLQLPVRGTPGNGLWGDTMDANLTLISPHDHGANGGAKVKTAGIQIDSDLTFSQTFAPKDLHRVQFSSVAALSDNAQNKSLFVSNGTGGLTANELYWRNSAGNHVKLTTGNTLNVASFAGGISGDFTSAGAAVTYDDALKRYIFKEGTADSNAWARVYCGGLRLAEFNSLEGLYVEQLAPAALAASYAMTWPLALPGSTLLTQVDNTGQISFSNTVPSAVTFSGNVTVNGTLSFPRTLDFHIALAHISATAGSNSTMTTTGGNTVVLIFGSVTTIDDYLPLQLPVGATITGWTVWLRKQSTSGTVSFKLRDSNGADATTAQIGSTQSNSASNPGFITLGQTGLSTVVTSGHHYWIAARSGGNTGGDDWVMGYSVTIS